jgi:hypothetical protein
MAQAKPKTSKLITRTDGVKQRYNTGRQVPLATTSTPSSAGTPESEQQTPSFDAPDGERNAEMPANGKTGLARQEADAAATDAIILAGSAERSADAAKSAMERFPDDEFSAHLERIAIRQKAEAEQAAELATELDPQGFSAALTDHMEHRAQRAAEFRTNRGQGQLNADEQQDWPDFY